MKALQLMFCNFRAMLLYHSTPKDRLAKIRREGLKPHGDVIRQENPSPFYGPAPLIRHGQVARLFSVT